MAAAKTSAAKTSAATKTSATAKTSAAPFVPAGADLPELGRASSKCQGCELYRDATQTVFGEGPSAEPPRPDRRAAR